jgi:hypothetical protein
LEHLSKPGEKRRYPRVIIDLPIDYRDTDDPGLCGGMIVNASRGGCLIESLRDICLGEKLSISVLFPKGFELANFPVTAEVMRKEPHSKRDWKGDTYWKGYQYGLKFIQILEADRWKLEFLLGERSYGKGPSGKK